MHFFILLQRLKSVCERILSKNRTKLSPFVSRGSNLYRAPQGEIECNDCVTWVSWPYSTTTTEKCLWTHPFENRTKLSPFVSRGSNLYRAPQGKIECNDCVTWVSWPSPLGQNRFIALFSRLCIFSFYYGDWKVFVNASFRKPNYVESLCFERVQFI